MNLYKLSIHRSDGDLICWVFEKSREAALNAAASDDAIWSHDRVGVEKMMLNSVYASQNGLGCKKFEFVKKICPTCGK